MLFDLFFELSVPPYLDVSEQDIYQQTLDQIALADTLNYHTAWLVEHHFMRHYSHASAPEIFLAAASQRSQRLRLGHAIVPLPYSHPVRVAERLSALDIVSNGRMEFGFGRGFSPLEYDTFGVAMKDSRSYTEESLKIIQQVFNRQPVSIAGKHFQFNELDVLPYPVQQPHPPIWTAAVSPESFEMAARLGIGALAGPFKPWFMVKEDIKLYRQAWAQHQGPDSQPLTAMTIGIYCHEDKKQARLDAKQPFEWFYRNLLEQTRPVLDKLYESYEYYRNMGRLNKLFGAAVNLRILETAGMAIVGTPEHCVKKLRALEKAGVDHAILAVGAGAMPADKIERSMQLISEQVIPQFQS